MKFDLIIMQYMNITWCTEQLMPSQSPPLALRENTCISYHKNIIEMQCDLAILSKALTIKCENRTNTQGGYSIKFKIGMLIWTDF